MAIVDLALPIRVTVGVPTVPGVSIDLFLKNPTWEERSAMSRAQTEHFLKLQFLYDKYSKGGDDSMKNLTPEEQKTFTKEVRAVESEFEDATSLDCLNYVKGFEDKKDGKVLYTYLGEDVLSSDPPEKWKPILHAFLGSALSIVWKQLLGKSAPSEASVSFSGNLLKN